ncbi:MAG TPA: peptide deformylase, partial [Patescibacteria group bacterium]|nr:peptide deformylase [Patescibacteria group bacterium]
VGRSLKIIVINLEKSGIPLMALYNAKVVGRSLKKAELEEGCLSIPGVFGLVKRPKKVTIVAQNGEGKTIRFTDDGWISRVAQHEIDHTNGRLIIDLIKRYSQGEEIVRDWKKQKVL